MNFNYTKKWVDPQFDKSRPIFFDTETSLEPHGLPFGGYTRLVQICQDQKCFIYDCFFMNIEKVKEYLKDCHLVAHNILYDLSCIDFQRWLPKSFDDSMHMSRHVLPFLESHSLKSVLGYFGLKKGDEGRSNWEGYLTQSQLQYAADDVLELEKVYSKLLLARDFFTYKLDMKNLEYALQYQLNGLPIHHKNRKAMIRDTKKKLKEVSEKLPPDLNINSPKQVCEHLGSDSSSSDVLAEMITDGNDEASNVLEARRLTKQLQFLEEKFKFDRIYGFFAPSGAKTGRWTCRAMEGANPNSQNLQQLPRSMKSLYGFEESDNRWLVETDFTSLEIFTIIGCFGEEKMAEIIRNGQDFHKASASLMYKIPYDEVTKTQRTLAKGANFSFAYGAGVGVGQKMMQGMSGMLLPLEEIKEMRDKWLQAFPTIKKTHDEASQVFSKLNKGEFAICHSPLGRPMRANSYTEYLASPPQSTGADAMKLVIHLLYQRVPEIRIVNSVHDALTIECMSHEEAMDLAPVVQRCFDESWEIILPNMKVENLFMKNQSDVVKVVGDSR